MKSPRLLVLAFTLSSVVQAQVQVPTDFERKVTPSVVRDRKVRIGGGDWDDKNDTVSFTVKFTNRDPATAFSGARVEFYVLGKNLVDTNTYKLLGKESFDMELAARGEFSKQTTQVTTRWDSTNIKFGARYDSWAMLVRDSAGAVLMKKSSSTTWQPLLEKLGELQVGESFDRQLRRRAIAQ